MEILQKVSSFPELFWIWDEQKCAWLTISRQRWGLLPSLPPTSFFFPETLKKDYPKIAARNKKACNKFDLCWLFFQATYVRTYVGRLACVQCFTSPGLNPPPLPSSCLTPSCALSHCTQYFAAVFFFSPRTDMYEEGQGCVHTTPHYVRLCKGWLVEQWLLCLVHLMTGSLLCLISVL